MGERGTKTYNLILSLPRAAKSMFERPKIIEGDVCLELDEVDQQQASSRNSTN